ncbi:MAG: transposase, partial [Akkermansiaceae bacterium]
MKLGKEWQGDPIRVVKIEVEGKELLIVTDLELEAELISLIETLWRTYTMLTDLESVFRSLKSELGMRPVYHHKEDRCDGHLFITVLAYQAVQVIRMKIKDHGINESWATLREKLKQQCRITATFKQRDGKTLHIRQASRP